MGHSTLEISVSEIKSILLSVVGVPLIFGITRYLASLCVLLPLRCLLRKFTPLMIAVVFAITGAAAIFSVSVVRSIATSWALPTVDRFLLIPATLIAFVFFMRLVLSVSARRPDPVAFESTWKPDPARSDEWNLHHRIRITEQASAWSLLAVLFGFALSFNFLDLSTLDPLWLRLFLCYSITGFAITVIHLGFGEVGTGGPFITILFGMVAWPIFLVYHLNKLLWVIRLDRL